MTRIKTPSMLQMEATECGAVSLGIILGYYGKWVSHEELRSLCGVSRDGVNIKNMLKAGEYFGLEGEVYQWDLDSIIAFKRPVVVFWNFNHFLVVEGSSKNHVYLNDPASGPKKVTKKEFNASYTGVAMELFPGENFTKGGKAPAPYRLLGRWLKGTTNPFVLLGIVSVLLVIPGVVTPAFLKVFIDDVLVQSYHSWLVPLLAGIFISMILSGLMAGFQQYFILRIRTKLSLSSASQFFWHLLSVPVVFFEQRYVGDVLSRVESCQNISSILSGPVVSSLINVFVVVFFLLVMLIYSWVLTLIVVLFAVVNISIFLLMQRRLRDTSLHSLNQQGKWHSVAMMGLQSIETLKANGAEDDFFTRWSGMQAKNLNITQQLTLKSSFLGNCPGTIGSLTNAVVYGAGALLIMQGELTIGGLVAFTHLLTQVTNPLNEFIGFALSFQQIRGDVTRVQDGLNYEIDPLLSHEKLLQEQLYQREFEERQLYESVVQQQPQPQELALDRLEEDILSEGKQPQVSAVQTTAVQTRTEQSTGLQTTAQHTGVATKEGLAVAPYQQLSGEVCFKNVSFAFSELSPPFLQDINFTITPGKRIAVVGKTGCGKSTLVQLIMGLKAPTAGEISYDGHHIYQIPRKIFTTSVAWVDQNIILFPGTVRDNLTLWDSSVSEPMMIQAAKDACIHEVVAERPGGYLSKITEGSRNFSSGQAQRLEIAKTLLINPTLLVLDEATSALDAVVEHRIMNNIKRRGCACLIVAHRLSTIRDSDEIIVLDNGRIIERGSHDQLLASEGHYAQLINTQFI